MIPPSEHYRPGDAYATVVLATLADGTTLADHRPVIVWARRDDPAEQATDLLVTWGTRDDLKPEGEPVWVRLRDDQSWATPSMVVRVERRIGRYTALDERANSVQIMHDRYIARAAVLDAWSTSHAEEDTLRGVAAERRATQARLDEVTARLRRLAVAAVQRGDRKAWVARDAGITRATLDAWLDVINPATGSWEVVDREAATPDVTIDDLDARDAATEAGAAPGSTSRITIRDDEDRIISESEWVTLP